MRDHTHDMMVIGAKVKGTVATFGISTHRSLPLRKQPVERKISGSKHSQVSMHRKYIFVGLKGLRKANGYSFLSNAAKPFADFILAQQDQHFLFNHSRFKQPFVKLFQQ